MPPFAPILLAFCTAWAALYLPKKLLRYHLETVLIRTNSVVEKDKSSRFFPEINVEGIYKSRNFEFFYTFPSRQSSFSLTITLAAGSKSHRKLLIAHPSKIESTDKQFVLIGRNRFDNRVAIWSEPKRFAEEMLSEELQERILSTLRFRYTPGIELTLYPSGRITVRQEFPWHYRKLESIFSLLFDLAELVVMLNERHS